ncbi:hypothetical protein [Marinoscillum sp.]|uniref:hypothetical protein n=1 Tax=Marinoscillum sp. TaxID=2024838 RepID=UPI003BA90C16
MRVFRIGGVPEYFNLPIKAAIADTELKHRDINLQWQDVTEGTGALTKMLHEGELDLAMILLEGATKSILDGQRCKIIKDFVSSPLQWGVHTSPNVHSLETLSSRRIAISRYGSGSHMMAYLMAEKYGWLKESLEFVVINNLDGAIEAFNRQEVDLFLWEKYTTKPYVDAGHMNCRDVVETPWPCFVLAANSRTVSAYSKELKQICQVINIQSEKYQSLKELPLIISSNYHLDMEDARAIVTNTRWSTELTVDDQSIQKVMNTYKQLQVINQVMPTEALIGSI